ncbi:MAG: hypothetical protein AB1486_25515 [Planctomycetota bacterium]
MVKITPSAGTGKLLSLNPSEIQAAVREVVEVLAYPDQRPAMPPLVAAMFPRRGAGVPENVLITAVCTRLDQDLEDTRALAEIKAVLDGMTARGELRCVTCRLSHLEKRGRFLVQATCYLPAEVPVLAAEKEGRRAPSDGPRRRTKAEIKALDQRAVGLLSENPDWGTDELGRELGVTSKYVRRLPNTKAKLQDLRQARKRQREESRRHLSGIVDRAGTEDPAALAEAQEMLNKMKQEAD